MLVTTGGTAVGGGSTGVSGRRISTRWVFGRSPMIRGSTRATSVVCGGTCSALDVVTGGVVTAGLVSVLLEVAAGAEAPPGRISEVRGDAPGGGVTPFATSVVRFAGGSNGLSGLGSETCGGVGSTGLGSGVSEVEGDLGGELCRGCSGVTTPG